jgi:cytochrome P450
MAAFLPLAPVHRPKHARALLPSTCHRSHLSPCKAVTDNLNFVPDKALPAPPKHRSLPLIGAILDTKRHGPALNGILAKRYGPVFRRDVFGFQMTVLSELEMVHAVLADHEAFPSGGAYPLEGIFGANAMFLQDGDVHARSRGRMAPAFSPAMFPTYCAPILGIARDFWAERSRECAEVREGGVLLDPLFRSLTFSIGVRLTSGISENVEHLEKLFLTVVAGMFAPKWFFGKFQRGVKARDEIVDIITAEIATRLKERGSVIDSLRSMDDPDAMVRRAKRDIETGAIDLFTILIAQSELQTGTGLEATGQQEEATVVAMQVLLLWFAAFETTSSSMSAAVFEMWRRPDLLQRLVAEQDALEARLGRSVEAVDVIKAMPLLSDFISESMRLHPPALTIFRKTGKDGATLGGHYVPQDTILMLDLAEPGRDAEVYPRPDEIDLNRYTADQVGRERARVARASLLAFGTGPHTCIAGALASQIAKTILSVLVSSYAFDLDSGQSLKFSVFPSHAPVSKVPLTVCTPRSKRAFARRNLDKASTS